MGPMGPNANHRPDANALRLATHRGPSPQPTAKSAEGLWRPRSRHPNAGERAAAGPLFGGRRLRSGWLGRGGGRRGQGQRAQWRAPEEGLGPVGKPASAVQTPGPTVMPVPMPVPGTPRARSTPIAGASPVTRPAPPARATPPTRAAAEAESEAPTEEPEEGLRLGWDQAEGHRERCGCEDRKPFHETPPNRLPDGLPAVLRTGLSLRSNKFSTSPFTYIPTFLRRVSVSTRKTG